MFEDRVAFDVFASRPIEMAELGDLSLTDDAGTQYAMVYPESPVLDGRGRIDFQPALPDGVLFSLGQPGWGLLAYRNDEDRG